MKIKLNLASQEDMATAMSSLAQVKSVTVEEAGLLGLLDEADFMTTTVVVKHGGKVEIPCWRHALINYPHPLLKKGLVILDTPGLNALGTEPELTLSMIPSAHAVLFLLAMDTGVTKSDLDVWQKYVQSYVTRRIAVLNKIDLMWDDLKTDAQIEVAVERQLVETARILGLPRDHVIALSAQKALIARIRGDAPLLAKSRIEAPGASPGRGNHPVETADPARRRHPRDRQHAGDFPAERDCAAGQHSRRAAGDVQAFRQEP